VLTVRFQPLDEGKQAGCSATPPTLWVRISDYPDDERPLTGGTIFVMNEQGKTVSRYDLGASPVPISGDGLRDPRPLGLHYSREQSLECATPVSLPTA
jgi:hypothetical protein